MILHYKLNPKEEVRMEDDYPMIEMKCSYCGHLFSVPCDAVSFALDDSCDLCGRKKIAKLSDWKEGNITEYEQEQISLVDRRKKLSDFQKSAIKLAEDNGEKMFLGVPDAWYEPPTYADINGHISSMYLKSEAKGGNVCLECQEPIYIVPPDTTEEQLEVILSQG